MKWLTQWLDHTVERICEWLNGILPGDHRLVAAGYGLAGIHKGFVLPEDRRLTPSVVHMAYDADSFTGQMKKSKAKAGTSALESDCGFWAYCHISGQPCQRCKPASVTGSINALTPGRPTDQAALCKQMGKKDGTAWYGCCKNTSGKVRIIAFADCCSPGYPTVQDCGGTDTSKWCENWPAAKNWCYNTVASSAAHKTPSGDIATYYCTVVMDLGECTT